MYNMQKAKKFLDDNGIKYDERHIVAETPTYEELKDLIEVSKLPISKFFNTSGILYRSMNLKEKLKNFTDEEKIRLLSSNGMLIKRPILIETKNIYVGFKVDEWRKLLEK